MKQTIIKIAVPLLAAMTVAGCATPFKAEVSRFERLPAVQGQSFYVTSQNPALQGGIEFETYANMVTQQLVAQGYTPTGSPQSADLLVNLDYGVNDGQQRVVQDYDPFYRGYGFYGYPYHGYYGRSRYISGWYDPFMFGPGGYSVRSYVVYTSELDMNIDRAADGTRLFEGKAMARSRTNDLPYLVPNLVEAMFTGFPGNSGETVKITVKDEDK